MNLRRLALASTAIARTHEAYLDRPEPPPAEVDWSFEPLDVAPFNAHEIDHDALTRVCVDQYGIPAAFFDQCDNTTAAEPPRSFWDAAPGQPYDRRDGL